MELFMKTFVVSNCSNINTLCLCRSREAVG